MANSLLDAITSPLTGEYRKEKPLSVQIAETGLDMTPVGTALEVGEELSSDKPSWLNIGLAVAPDVLGLGPVADPLMKAIKGTKFKTAKGSTYEVQDGNTTVRNKAARPEHPGESGVQPQSVKTIYMPRSELEKFGGVHQNPDIPTEFIPTGSDTAALRLTKDWGPLKAGDILPETEVKFTLEPEVGLNPVEILDFKNPRGIHFGNEIIEVESNVPKVNKKYAEGGVAMDEQMDAVFKSSRTEVDPVSGNEVPPGSLPEEVRDDIPAMLSEGEYVVPADVLRFYGVKFFEDLRAEAKMGLAEMEANGRIGGEPIETEEDDLPFADEELMVEEDTEQEVDSQMMAAMGGVVGYQQGGFQSSIPAWMSNLQNIGPGIGGGTQFKTFINDRGQELSVLVGADNQPIFAIPAGYRLKTERAPTETTPVEEAVTTKRKDDDDNFVPASAQRARDRITKQQADKEIDFNDPQSVEGAVNTYYSSQPLLQMAASSILGLPGLAASYGIKKYEKNNLLKGINTAIEESDDPITKTKLESQKELLEDKDKWKTSYEERTEGLGLLDTLKSAFSSEEIDKKYTKPKDITNKKWKEDSIGEWVDATNLVNSLGSDADPREWSEAIRAQSEASRKASAAIRSESGWTGGFFGSASNDDENDTPSNYSNTDSWEDDEGFGVG